jgi:serine/threonine-protein kinase
MPTCVACGKSHHPDKPCADGGAERIGRIVGGKYRIVRHIGEGGMASVYEAQHTEIRRSFALKFLHPWLCEDEEWLERFRREASAGGALISEHITAIVDIDFSNSETPYIVMEYLEGEDLGQRLAREHSLKPSDAIEIITQACCGLGVAHSAGVIHRDLKPENLFLCQRQLGGTVVKILDFGIAKLKNSHLAQVTRAGMVIGTPFYMSPEQAVGRADVDHRSDIYALGVILYELLSGEKPFVGDNHNGVLNQIIAGGAPDLQDQCPTVSAELARVVERAIARSPADRYQNAAEFAEALSAFSPPVRRSSRTASNIGSRASWRALSALSQPTLAEPNLTVRATGSGRKLDFGSSDEALEAKTELHDAIDHSAMFGDLTEAQLPLDPRDSYPPARFEAEPLMVSDSVAAAHADNAEHALSAPPTSRSRTRSNVGSFQAVRVPLEALNGMGRETEPQVLSVKTVSLRKTLAPLAAGILAIVLLVTGLTWSSRPSDAADLVSSAVERGSNDTLAASQGSNGPALQKNDVAPEVLPRAQALPSEAEPFTSAPSSSQQELATAPDSSALEVPARPGRLSVQSIPSAELVVGGKRRGRTPLRGLRLAPGEYRVVLSHPEHGRRVRTVRIDSEQLTAVSVRFVDEKKKDAPAPVASEEAPVPEKTSTQPIKPPPPARNCSPRWYVDDRGVKRVKPECLID